MNILAAFTSGLSAVFSPVTLLWIGIGSVIATVLGIIPVLGGELGITLCLPFLVGKSPLIVMPFVLAMDAVSCTGGSITSILLNIPGTLINAATCMDGHPMAQKGEGGRAVGAALVSSAVGGIITVPMALLMIPILVPFILKFKSTEMFLLIVCGICFISVLTTKGHVLRGLISAVLGLLLACVGAQGQTGYARFTFNNAHLYDGLPLIIVVLGMYAVPSLVNLFLTGKPVAADSIIQLNDRKQLRQGGKDVIKHWWLTLKCAIVGYVIGVIPGIGAFTSTFMTYGMAKKSSKTPEEFGKGCVEGVIAPEAANNAKESGGLLTTLAFGIPGTGTMAIIMATLMVIGIQPGPAFLTENTSLCVTMISSIAIANLIAVILCWFNVPLLTKITRVDPKYIFALVIPLVFLGAFSNAESMFDICLVILTGLLGYCMKIHGYSAPSLILGFVLGGDLEYYLWRSIDINGPAFIFSSPISIVLTAIIVLVIVYKPVVGLFKKIKGAKA